MANGHSLEQRSAEEPESSWHLTLMAGRCWRLYSSWTGLRSRSHIEEEADTQKASEAQIKYSTHSPEYILAIFISVNRGRFPRVSTVHVLSTLSLARLCL